MRESTQSSMPPLPGNKFPLSLTPQARLKTDSIRSPTIPASAVTIETITIFQTEPKKIGEKKCLNKSPQATEVIIPPKKPTILLFGLAAKTPRVDFPNNMPKNHAPESHINTRIK